MQVNKIETTKKMKMIDYQCDVLKESSKKYEITERGITELDPNTRYEGTPIARVRVFINY